MSNVNAEGFVESDWWTKPVPPGVVWGEGWYCETAQIFRHYKAEKNPAVIIGNHVSCYAGCAFAIGKKGFPPKYIIILSQIIFFNHDRTLLLHFWLLT